MFIYMKVIQSCVTYPTPLGPHPCWISECWITEAVMNSTIVHIIRHFIGIRYTECRCRINVDVDERRIQREETLELTLKLVSRNN